MIKLKDILLESTAPDIFVPRRLEDRIERMIRLYVKNGSKGDLDLSDLNLTKLPEILKNISVGRDFFCGTNNLTSLENCPKTVGGSFYCGHNKLTSLDGATEYVGGSFYCSFNNLKSLQCAHIIVGGDFYCYDNELKSLFGAPETVGGDFYCYNNPGNFTEEQVRAVCDVKGKIFV
jgi:hypothetical protein